jgi:predicted porin
MKKALLAVLIPSLLATTSVFAGGVDLIKNDDMTLNFNGDIDLKSWTKFEDGKSQGTETEVIFDDIDFDFVWNVSDDLQFISGVDLTADGGNETDDGEAVVVDLIWVGVKTKYGQLQWGNLETSFDPLGIDNSELYTGMASGDADGESTSHENAIKYDYTMGDLWLSATYGIPGEEKANTKIMNMAWKYTPGDLQVNGGFGQTTEYSSGAEAFKAVYVQAEVEYDFGDFVAAALISHEDEEIANVETTGFEVDFTYKATSKLKLHAGADFLTQDIAGVSVDF